MAPPTQRIRRESEAAPAPLVLAGRALVGGRLQPVEIAIDEHGRIASLGRVRDGEHRHDVGDAVIVPAATDLHVHLRDPPGLASGESLPTGTVGAALGGVGLVGEMPNTEPPVDSLERFEEKAARVRGRAAVDVLLYAIPGDRRQLPALARVAGGFKVFLSPTTQLERPVAPDELARLLGDLASYDLPVVVHAEDPARFKAGTIPSDPRGWDLVRPPAAEASAVERVLAAAPAGLRLHVAHMTSADLAEKLLARGVSFEATPHHLLLSERSGADARFKVNPPLRDEPVRRALWETYRRGGVPCVASDHAPHPADAKARKFAEAPSGMPGVETMLPLLLARVRSGELPLELVLASLCDRPARWLGQPTGRLAVGHRANLLVIDFRRRSTVRADDLHAPCGWTAFEGHEAIFPSEHWRDGVRIVTEYEYVGRPDGRIVRPEFAPGAESVPVPRD